MLEKLNSNLLKSKVGSPFLTLQQDKNIMVKISKQKKKL